MINQNDTSLKQQVHRLIIENRDETGAIDASDQSAMADEILELIDEQKQSLLDELLEEMPTPSKYNKNGKLRPFSTKTVWEYGDVYVKGEESYRTLVRQLIEGKGQT